MDRKLSKAQKGMVILSAVWLTISFLLADESRRYFLSIFLFLSSPVLFYWAGVWIWGWGYLTRLGRHLLRSQLLQSIKRFPKFVLGIIVSVIDSEVIFLSVAAGSAFIFVTDKVSTVTDPTYVPLFSWESVAFDLGRISAALVMPWLGGFLIAMIALPIRLTIRLFSKSKPPIALISAWLTCTKIASVVVLIYSGLVYLD